MDGGRTDDADHALVAARLAEAAARRRARRREMELAGTELTLPGVLAGVAALGVPTVLLRGGRRSVVAVQVVGADMVAVTDEAGRAGFVRLAAIEALEPGGAVGSVSAEPVVTDRTFADALGDVVGTAEPVLLRTRHGTELRGSVTALGEDVVELHAPGPAGSRTYVALDSLSEVWLSSSIG